MASIAAARTASAATYAVEDLAAADASLRRYDEFVAQRDYKQALSMALDARDRGFEVAKAAVANETALRTDADRLLKALDAALVGADAQLKIARPRAMARRVDTLRQTRKATAVAMQEARALITDGELTRATRRLGDAIAALKRDSDALDTAAQKTKK